MVSWRRRTPSSPSVPTAHNVLSSFCLTSLPLCSEPSSFRHPALVACLSRLGWAQLPHPAGPQPSWLSVHGAVEGPASSPALWGVLYPHPPELQVPVAQPELHRGEGAGRAREEGAGQGVMAPGILGAESPNSSKVAGGPRGAACPCSGPHSCECCGYGKSGDSVMASSAFLEIKSGPDCPRWLFLQIAVCVCLCVCFATLGGADARPAT